VTRMPRREVEDGREARCGFEASIWEISWEAS